MKLPLNKTKIVCTIGPASSSPEIMEEMLLAGMNVARINLSHGDFPGHRMVIKNLRSAAEKTGRRLAIMADLPGPKMRIGRLAQEHVELRQADTFTLTTREIIGDARGVSVSFQLLPEVVRKGDTLFINDGLIQLEVSAIEPENVICRVIVGGELYSRKGLNLPGIDLGISAFTERDRECLTFALEQGVDAVSQSFVESGADMAAVRRAADNLGYSPFIIAKIERARALDHMDDILDASDGIMIARGDLGVEIPIERIALVQKQIMRQANLLGKPVITATQMLESMTSSPRPTRAEATDVANAVLDGTDCVMLSGESAVGKYPVEAVTMLSRLAAAIEPHWPSHHAREELKRICQDDKNVLTDLIAFSVESAMECMAPAAVFVPTRSGTTARSVTRFRLPVWIIAVSSQEATCRQLQFSSGVYPVHQKNHPENWNAYIREWLRSHDMGGNLVLLTEGPSLRHPEANRRMEIIDLSR